MKIATILILTTLLGGPPTLAQDGGTNQEAERVQEAREKKQGQDAERTKDAREQKKVQDAERTKNAREQKKVQDAERTKNAREQKKGQDAERTKKARDQKQGQDAERTKKARDQNQDQEAERMKALREERRANRLDLPITGGRVPGRGAPQDRAGKARQGSQGDVQRNERARQARADEQRKQVSEFTREVRDHRVRLAKIDRLQGVYESQGDSAKAGRVRALRQRELQNFERVVARSRKQLGTEHFKSVAKRLKLDD